MICFALHQSTSSQQSSPTDRRQQVTSQSLNPLAGAHCHSTALALHWTPAAPYPVFQKPRFQGLDASLFAYQQNPIPSIAKLPSALHFPPSRLHLPLHAAQARSGPTATRFGRCVLLWVGQPDNEPSTRTPAEGFSAFRSLLPPNSPYWAVHLPAPPCPRPPFSAHSLGLSGTSCAPDRNVSMPGLGFLKKKRTRDTDPSATSQPASPVTPTTARSFDAATLPTSPTNSLPQKVAPAAPRPLSEGEKGAMYSATAQPPTSFAPPAHTPSPGTDPNHLQPGVLPSIANLINPPQNDSAAQPQLQQQSIPTSQLLEQQTQNQFPAPPQNGGTAPQQPTQQQMATMAQQPTPSTTPQSHQTAMLQQTRQTKGKYSLADFEILRTLGTGSFGRVHLVQSRHNQRFYAVKVLKKAQVVKMKQVEHTNDERKMLGEVKHPFLITLWGTFQDPRNLYMVMDFVEGGELFSLLRKSGVCLLSSPMPHLKWCGFFLRRK